jgi:hypothetical protein
MAVSRLATLRPALDPGSLALVLFFGLASRRLEEVVEFYDTAEQAAAALSDALRDEPQWRGDLYVVAVLLPDPAAAAPSPN